MVWTCCEERPGVCRKKGDGNGVTGKEEKREAEKKIYGCSKGGYGRSWCKGGHLKQDAVKEHHMLWRPLITGKGRKKDVKINLNCYIDNFLCYVFKLSDLKIV